MNSLQNLRPEHRSLVRGCFTAHGEQMAAAANNQGAGAVVDANGNLKVPPDYRTSYQFLGSWAIASDKA